MVFGLAVQSHSLLKVMGSNGWYADLQMRDTAQSFPLLLVIIRDGSTNTEFILENQKFISIPLNYPDGDYQYYLYDSTKKTLFDKGIFSLYTPFSASVKTVGTDTASAEIMPAKPVFIEVSVLSGGKLLEKKKVQVRERIKLDFTGLEPNRVYQMNFSAADYSVDHPFKTKKKNLALNKPVLGTFTRFPESRFVDDTTPAITRINDGLISWYRGMAVSEECSAREQLALINLEKLSQLGQIRIVWHGLYYPLRYEFVFSRNGRDWQAIERKKDDLKNGIAPDNSPIVTDDFTVKVSAQFIGVKIKKGQAIRNREALRNFVELMEIEAYE